jgi:hypothetical protein
VLQRQYYQTLLRDYCSLLLEKDRDVIITGEFGFIPDKQDSSIPVMQTPELLADQGWLHSMNQLGFRDCFRHFYPNDHVYSSKKHHTIFRENRAKDVPVFTRSSFILTNQRFLDAHVVDCFYLKFNLFVPPEMYSRTKRPVSLNKPDAKSESEDPTTIDDEPHNPSVHHQAETQLDTEESQEQRPFKPKPKPMVVKPNCLPIVLQTNIPVKEQLPPSRFFTEDL